MEIPSDLVAAVSERRVIPFVGAGFSASMGLPDWGQLLSRLADNTDGALPYKELHEYTGGDYLQIAEYLYLKSDKRIGPLRHVIERGMPEHVDPSASAAHVELVNLGAPQIYTTNYDDLIESIYRALGLAVNVVALGKDVAVAGRDTTQVVKYHGDLRHESTLVLTESSYFKRLDFESAMDVKFRADLLGRSVLFMGYSFRDINIRLIWYKLNQMMEEIPTADRRQSYIVRLERNPVLEELYEAVGLKTIVLDQPGEVIGSGRTRHPRLERQVQVEVSSLGSFLAQLATLASAGVKVIPGSSIPLFASRDLLEHAERECEVMEKRSAEGSPTYAFSRSAYLRSLFDRKAPPVYEDRYRILARRALAIPPTNASIALRVVEIAQAEGASVALTSYVAQTLLRLWPTAESSPSMRDGLVRSSSVDWKIVWSAVLDREAASSFLEKFRLEIEWNKSGNADMDIAFMADLAKRIADGIIVGPGEDELKDRAKKLIAEAGEIYPAVLSLEVGFGPPEIGAMAKEIEARSAILPDEDDWALLETAREMGIDLDEPGASST